MTIISSFFSIYFACNIHHFFSERWRVSRKLATSFQPDKKNERLAFITAVHGDIGDDENCCARRRRWKTRCRLEAAAAVDGRISRYQTILGFLNADSSMIVEYLGIEAKESTGRKVANHERTSFCRTDRRP
ncbi:hypothetical protein L1987_01628 [Smallanthus sonchifolius]|uniref:Uncharacterized protein n=1 Tax=Smallanthus sonchifolius TaxID=185202 RepID=A0ACB9K5G0_9ASTR|nr:hypothetical protein L1987_01628 [Smallanthus sonchifolius]